MNDGAPWLERELARQLAPVAAPHCLWSCIHQARRSERQGVSFRWTVWPAVALVTLTVCASVFWRISRGVSDSLTEREVTELMKGPRDFDFRSNDFGAVRSWVKTTADIDIDLPNGSPATENAPVRLVGVRMLRLGTLRVAAIDYRIGDDTATLLVCGKRRAAGSSVGHSKHVFSEMNRAGTMTGKATGKTRMVSWNMRNENYTIAFSGASDAHGACLLCHANMPGLLTMN